MIRISSLRRYLTPHYHNNTFLRHIQTSPTVTKPPAAVVAELNLKSTRSGYIPSSSTTTFIKDDKTISQATNSCVNDNHVNTETPKQHGTGAMRIVLSCDDTEHKNNTKETPTTTDKEIWLRKILDNSQHENTVLREIELKTQFVSNIPLKYRADNALDPTKCVGVDTEMGRNLLASTLHGDVHGRIFFTLWQQFLTQSDSLLCGPSSMVMVLNALKVK